MTTLNKDGTPRKNAHDPTKPKKQYKPKSKRFRPGSGGPKKIRSKDAVEAGAPIKEEVARRGPDLKGPTSKEDFDDLEKLLHMQCTQDECCAWFDCDDKTLTRRIQEYYGMSFKELSDLKRNFGKISLRRAQWQKATSGNVPLLIWLGKQYLGQRDKYEELKPDEDDTENTDFEALDAEIKQRSSRLNSVKLKGRNLEDFESKLLKPRKSKAVRSDEA